LPADYLEVILLRDFVELSFSEMVAKLAISVPATKSRLRRARLLAREYQPASSSNEIADINHEVYFLLVFR
jgi:DNA-directed RNA polymerase specialized sigma24 family protein